MEMSALEVKKVRLSGQQGDKSGTFQGGDGCDWYNWTHTCTQVDDSPLSGGSRFHVFLRLARPVNVG